MGNLHNAFDYHSRLGAWSRVLGVGVEHEGVSRLGETLTPTVDLYRDPFANIHLGNWLFIYNTPVVAAGGAGTRSKLILVGAVHLILVKTIVTTAQAIAVRLLATPGGYTFTDRVISRDTRLSPLTPLQPEIFVQNTTGAAGTRAANIPANFDFECDFVISPGFSLLIDPDIDNTALMAGVTLLGQLKSPLPGELRL